MDNQNGMSPVGRPRPPADPRTAERRYWSRVLGAGRQVAIAGALALTIPSLATSEPHAYVTNQASEDRVWVLDIATNTVIDTVTVEDIPARVAITPDGAFAYVTIVVDEDELQQAGKTLLSSVVSSPVFLGSHAKSQASSSFFSNKVAVIDTSENTVVTTITTDVAPFGIAISPDGASAWVTHLGPAVTVIDVATNTVTDIIPLPDSGGVTDIAITPDGAFAYVPLSTGDAVAVIDTATRTVLTSIPVSERPAGVAITPDGANAYITNVRSDTVAVIDVAANAIVATVPVGEAPTGIAITPDGESAWVLNQLSGDISVIETAGNTVLATITGDGDTPIDVAISPDGAFAYVTDIFMDSVSVIDTATHTLVETVPVGFLSEYIAITPASIVLELTIDIMPGNDRNRISPSQGSVWVAILSEEGFDASRIDAATVRFGPEETLALRTGVRDVDMDGTLDLLVRFHVADAGIACGDTTVALSGRTIDGLEIAGEDAIETVGCVQAPAGPA